MRTNVPPMVRGQLIGRVGDKRALVGLGVEHKLHEVFARIALDIKFDARIVGEKGGKLANIATGHMTLIGSRMHRDTFHAQANHPLAEIDHTGEIAPP